MRALSLAQARGPIGFLWRTSAFKSGRHYGEASKATGVRQTALNCRCRGAVVRHPFGSRPEDCFDRLADVRTTPIVFWFLPDLTQRPRTDSLIKETFFWSSRTARSQANLTFLSSAVSLGERGGSEARVCRPSFAPNWARTLPLAIRNVPEQR